MPNISRGRQRARNMPRAIWKGSISFGLVHIPVSLFPAVRTDSIDFDWLDKRSLAPIGYRRVSKQTGREVDRKFIVRGYQYAKGRYVVVSDEEIRAANAKATQSVDILCFADLQEVPFLHLETPYFLAPDKKGAKVYALLREALKKTGKIGIAHVVMHTKQHLAALIPSKNALMLNTLRRAGELRKASDLDLPGGGTRAAGISEKELSMAQHLIEDMTERLDFRKFHDSFRDDILALVQRKIKKGKSGQVEVPQAVKEPRVQSNVIDLAELLQRSLHGAGVQASGHPVKKSPRRTARAKSRGAQSRTQQHRRAS